MRYRFNAVDAQGKREHGEIVAASERSALKLLAARGLSVIALSEMAEAARAQRNRRIGAADRALAVRQLSGLLEGGVTLPNALLSVANNTGIPSIQRELTAVNSALTSGEPLADAFGKAPQLLPAVERQVVVAGAEAGNLSQVFSRLADYFEDREALRGRLVGALVYPALVGIVALGVIVALLVFVMPQIVSAFAQTQQQLPWLTRAMLALADFMKQYGWAVLIALLGSGIVLTFLLRGPLRKRGLRFLQRLPLLGPLVQTADEVRVLNTLAMLVESAVPLPRALQAAAKTARFPYNHDRILAAHTLLTQGGSIAGAMADAEAVDGMSLELIRQGEAVGSVAQAFGKAAHLKRQALERKLQWFATLIEPLMIVFLGAIVLILVLAVMLPIVSLNSAVK